LRRSSRDNKGGKGERKGKILWEKRKTQPIAVLAASYTLFFSEEEGGGKKRKERKKGKGSSAGARVTLFLSRVLPVASERGGEKKKKSCHKGKRNCILYAFVLRQK